MKLSAISWYIFIRLFFAVEAALEEDHSVSLCEQQKNCKLHFRNQSGFFIICAREIATHMHKCSMGLFLGRLSRT